MQKRKCEKIAYSRKSGGISYYNSVQIGVNKRFRHGLNMQFSYTLSKQLEKLRYIEPSDPALSQMTGQFDNPHRVSTGIIYELPFGAGKPLRSDAAVVNKFIGGWRWGGRRNIDTTTAGPPPPGWAPRPRAAHR